MPERDGTVVVCGGGGVWGIAWMTGLAAGLADAGVALRSARGFIGTSAGAVIASQLTSTLDLDDLYARQANPLRQRPETSPPPGRFEAMVKLLQQPWESPDERLRAICTLARTSDTIAQDERRADIADRVGLPAQGWPETALSITAVDVETLQLSVFNAQSGVSLIDAVAASCAVPGVWPPAEIQGRLYIDGGVWKTPENAHLAVGASRVVILSPFGQVGMGSGGEAGLSADIERLQAAGAEVQVVAADAPSLQAMAPSPLDPATRKPAAEAGRRQAADVARRLRHLF